MIEFGCLARHFRAYGDEVRFARENGFKFMQLWYDRQGLLFEDARAQVKVVKEYHFPAIIHALLDINEFNTHIPILLDIVKNLGHKELIIHPVCKSEVIEERTIFKLVERVKYAVSVFSSEGITLFLENNSKLDPVFTNADEVEIMFKEVPGLEFLMDIAHMDNYENLKQMVDIRMPKILHIADRHLEIVHEHLPVGEGNIDFKYIFNNIMNYFDGKIILEIFQSDADIIYSKAKLQNFIDAGRND